MDEFKGKVALVTGSTSGLGKEAALAFGKTGAKVVITGRREKEGAETAQEIESAGGEALFVQCDVADEEQVRALVKQIKDSFGEISYCFANAGVWGDPQSVVDETKENIDKVIDINVKGMFYTLKHVIPSIVANGGGAVVTNSSILGLSPMPGFSVYNASKFAVEGLTRTAAQEFAEKNVRINSVAPGPIETDMLLKASGGDTSSFAEIIPMKRTGRPEEIANTVLFLCSSAASFINGQSIAVDGGYTAG